jgi:hypothetical protein
MADDEKAYVDSLKERIRAAKTPGELKSVLCDLVEVIESISDDTATLRRNRRIERALRG